MKRVVWLDLVRIFSILFVIMIHVSCMNWFTESPLTINWHILNFYDSISRFCVPVFLMISGALFLSKKEINIEKLYKKNILRLVIALVFWALFYALLSNASLLINFSKDSVLAVINSFNGIHYHLHFLLGLIGLYIISPILKKVVEDEKLFKYLLSLSVLFAIIIPTINITFNYINLFTGNNSFSQLYYSLTNWLFKINIPYVSGYLVFFLTGYKLYKEPIKNKKRIYVLGIIATLFTVLSASFISYKLNTAVGAYYDYNLINTYLMAIALFTFFKEEVSKIKFKEKTQQFIKTLSDCIFGIYLIHDAFIIVINKLCLYPRSISYVISVPLVTLVIFILGFIVIYIIRKIPKIHEYIS